MMASDWRKPPAWLILLMWLALPISALEYKQNWDRLPQKMAVHFDASFQPNGFTTREGAFDLGMTIMAVMLVLFTIAAFAVRALKGSPAWPLLVVFYIVIGFAWYGNYSIVKFNLNRFTAYPPLNITVPSGQNESIR